MKTENDQSMLFDGITLYSDSYSEDSNSDDPDHKRLKERQRTPKGASERGLHYVFRCVNSLF